MTSEERLLGLLECLDGWGRHVEEDRLWAAALRDVLARLAAAEEDARRLDWLEGRDDITGRSRRLDGTATWYDGGCGCCADKWAEGPATLRDAIDAARKGEGK
jgi:hypothetical protein